MTSSDASGPARRRRTGPLRWVVRGLAALVLLEVALQLAAPLYRALSARDGGTLSPDAPLTVLCVGDSHTFGLNMPRLASYPERLAALLAPRFAAPVSVVNRGVPGQNAAQVAAALPADLRDVDPDIVVVLAGINDTWNRDAEGGGSAALLGRLKLVRLARVLAAGVTSAGRFEVRSDDQGRIVVDRGAGERPVNMGAGAVGVRSGEALAASVRAQLARCLALVREAGARPVLMTYAEFQDEFATVNAAARGLAADEGVLLVDHERDFARHFASEGYESLMMNDHHPNARGYALMASAVERALAEAGWVPAATAGGAPDAPGLQPAAALDLRCDESGALLLAGPPGAPFQLLIAGAAGSEGGFLAGSARIPLLEDALLALSRAEPSFSGRLDAQGTARVAVPAALRQAGSGAEWAACAVLLSERADGPPVVAVSPAVPIRF